MPDEKPRSLQIVDNKTNDTLNVDWYDKELPTDAEVDEMFAQYRQQKAAAAAPRQLEKPESVAVVGGNPMITAVPPQAPSKPTPSGPRLEYDQRGNPILPDVSLRNLHLEAPAHSPIPPMQETAAATTGVSSAPKQQPDLDAAINVLFGPLYGQLIKKGLQQKEATSQLGNAPVLQFPGGETAKAGNVVLPAVDVSAQAPTPQETAAALQNATPEEKAAAARGASEMATQQERPISKGYEAPSPESVSELYTTLLNPLSGLFRGVETMQQAAESYRMATKLPPLEAGLKASTAIAQGAFGAMEAAPYLTGMLSPTLSEGLAGKFVNLDEALAGKGGGAAEQMPFFEDQVKQAGVFKAFQAAQSVPVAREVLSAAMAPTETFFKPKPGLSLEASRLADMLATLYLFDKASKVRNGEPLSHADIQDAATNLQQRAVDQQGMKPEEAQSVAQGLVNMADQYQASLTTDQPNAPRLVPKNPYARLVLRQMQDAFTESARQNKPFDVSPWMTSKNVELFRDDPVSTQDMADLATSVRAYNSQFAPAEQPKRPPKDKLQRMKQASKAVNEVLSQSAPKPAEAPATTTAPEAAKAPEQAAAPAEQTPAAEMPPRGYMTNLLKRSGEDPKFIHKLSNPELFGLFKKKGLDKLEPPLSDLDKGSLQKKVAAGEITQEQADKAFAQRSENSLKQIAEDKARAAAKMEQARAKLAKGEAVKLEAGQSYKAPITDIHLDTKRFQNRSELDEEHVQNIVKNYNEGEFDPVVIWKDPKTGKSWLLSGHHRFEAAKRLGLKDIMVREWTGDEASARAYAKGRSNANRAMEKPWDRAKIYRELRAGGTAESQIAEKAKAGERGNAALINDLSRLNPKGKALSELPQLPEASEGGRDALTIAQWAGKLRKAFPDLSDAHENEIYDYLKDNYKTEGKKFKRYADAEDAMRKVVERQRGAADKLDATKPLNIKEVTPESPQESKFKAQFEEERGSAENAVKAFEEKLAAKKKSGAPKAEIDSIQSSLKIAKDDLAKIDAKIQEGVTKIRSNEIGLFDQAEAPKTEAKAPAAEEKKSMFFGQKRRLMRGMKEPIDVVFADKTQQDLFDYAARRRGSMKGEEKFSTESIEKLRTELSEELGIDRQAVAKLAKQEYDRIRKLASEHEGDKPLVLTPEYRKGLGGDVSASPKTTPKPTVAERKYAEEQARQGNLEPARQIAQRVRQIAQEEQDARDWKKMQSLRDEADQIRREIRSGQHTHDQAVAARGRLADVTKEIGRLERRLATKDGGLLAEKNLDLFAESKSEHLLPEQEVASNLEIKRNVLRGKSAGGAFYVGIDEADRPKLEAFARKHPVMGKLSELTKSIFRDIYDDMSVAFTKRGWQMLVEDRPKVGDIGFVNTRSQHGLNVGLLDRHFILLNPDVLSTENRIGLNRPDQIAAHWVNTLIHEAVHNYTHGHEEYYSILREYALGHLGGDLIDHYNSVVDFLNEHQGRIENALDDFQEIAKEPSRIDPTYAATQPGRPGSMGQREVGQSEGGKVAAEGVSEAAKSAKPPKPNGPDFQVNTDEMRQKNDEAARDLAAALRGGVQPEIFENKPTGKAAKIRPNSVVSDLRSKTALLMMEGMRQGYKGDALTEYVRGQLIDTIKSSAQYKLMSAESRLKALDRANSEGIARWLKFFQDKNKKAAIVQKAEITQKELLQDIQRRLAGSGLPPEEIKRLFDAASDMKYSQGSANTFFKLFASRPLVFSKYYGAAGGKLVRLFYEGDVQRADLTETANIWVARVRDLDRQIDGYFESKRVHEAVANALNDRANAEKILADPRFLDPKAKPYRDPKSAEVAKKMYAEAKDFFDYFKLKLKEKGYDVLEDYFPHMKKLFDSDFLLQNLDDIEAGKPRPLADILAAKSPYLKPREDLLQDWRKNVLAAMQHYVRSVTRAVAYHDALDYAHGEFVREIPEFLSGNTLEKATSYIRNVLDPDKAEGALFRGVTRVRRWMYDNFLLFNFRASMMNSTQFDLARLFLTKEGVKAYYEVYKHENTGTALADAAEEAGMERPSFLGEMLLEDPREKQRIRKWVDENDWFKKQERRNWAKTEMATIIDSAIRNKNWKRIRAKYEAGPEGTIKALSEVLSDPEAYSRAVEEARYISAVSQVASSPAMRAEFYDKPLLRIIGMFTAFKTRQIQLLVESLGKHEGVLGRNAQHALRMGLVDAVPKVEVLRTIETQRAKLEKWFEKVKEEKEDIGISHQQMQQFIDYLKTQEKGINQDIAKMVNLRSRGENVALLAKYYSKIFSYSIAWSGFTALIGAAYNQATGNAPTQSTEDQITQALQTALGEVVSMPWYGTNPAKFLVSPVMPDIEAKQFGKFEPRMLSHDLVSYGMNALPYGGFIDRVTGHQLSKAFVDLATPKATGTKLRGSGSRSVTRKAQRGRSR